MRTRRRSVLLAALAYGLAWAPPSLALADEEPEGLEEAGSVSPVRPRRRRRRGLFHRLFGRFFQTAEPTLDEQGRTHEQRELEQDLARCRTRGEDCGEYERALRGGLWVGAWKDMLLLAGIFGSAAATFAALWRERREYRLPRILRNGRWDLTAIDLVVDATALPRQRETIERLTRHATDIRPALPAVVQVLRGLSWTHVALRQWPSTTEVAAKANLATLRESLGRRAEGSTEAPVGYREGRARSPRQAVLVTLAVLTRVELPEESGKGPDAVRVTLERLRALQPDEIETFELFWYPSERHAATSETELLEREPRLLPV